MDEKLEVSAKSIHKAFEALKSDVIARDIEHLFRTESQLTQIHQVDIYPPLR